MANTLKTDTNGVLYEGVRDAVGARYTAKQGIGTVTSDADGVLSQALAVGFPDANTTGTVTLANDAVSLALSGGQATATFQITGTFVGTLNFEGSADGGTTWVPVTATQVGTNAVGTSTTATGDWRANVAGLTNVRVRLNPVTSGSASIRLNLSMGLQNVTITNAQPLGQQTMAQSSSVVVASDQLVPVQSGSLVINGATPAVLNAAGVNLIPPTDVSAYNYVALQLVGTFTLTLQLQLSNDNTNWTSINTALASGYTSNNFGSPSSPGLWVASLFGFRYLRVNCTAFTSNTSLVGTARLSAIPPVPQLQTAAVVAQATTGGGTNDYHLVSAASTNPASIKASGGQVYGYQLGNNGASDAYVKLYNKASAPTVGTDVPFRTIYVPKGQQVSFVSAVGLHLGTGIGLAITGGAADTDATAVAAAQVVVDIDYL